MSNRFSRRCSLLPNPIQTRGRRTSGKGDINRKVIVGVNLLKRHRPYAVIRVPFRNIVATTLIGGLFYLILVPEESGSHSLDDYRHIGVVSGLAMPGSGFTLRCSAIAVVPLASLNELRVGAQRYWSCDKIILQRDDATAGSADERNDEKGLQTMEAHDVEVSEQLKGLVNYTLYERYLADCRGNV